MNTLIQLQHHISFFDPPTFPLINDIVWVHHGIPTNIMMKMLTSSSPLGTETPWMVFETITLSQSNLSQECFNCEEKLTPEESGIQSNPHVMTVVELGITILYRWLNRLPYDFV